MKEISTFKIDQMPEQYPIAPPVIKKSQANQTNKWSVAGIVIVILLIIVSGVSYFKALVVNNLINIKKAEAQEAVRPANIEIVSISDKNCTDCKSLDAFLNIIKGKSVNVVKEQNLDLLDQPAQALIKQYNITKVPTFIVTGELEKFDDLKQLWTAWGTVNSQAFVLTNVPPPYFNIQTGTTDGKVTVIYLNSKSCADCYDVNNNKNILENGYGLKVVSEKTVDVADKEGKELVKKYKITKIPTFVLNSEIAVYQGLLSVWNSVGSLEQDGWYVFRKPEVMGAYYDLDKSEVVKPAANPSTNTNNGQ